MINIVREGAGYRLWDIIVRHSTIRPCPAARHSRLILAGYRPLVRLLRSISVRHFRSRLARAHEAVHSQHCQTLLFCCASVLPGSVETVPDQQADVLTTFKKSAT